MIGWKRGKMIRTDRKLAVRHIGLAEIILVSHSHIAITMRKQENHLNITKDKINFEEPV